MINLIDPSARMQAYTIPNQNYTSWEGVNALRRIEYQARISHRSEDAQTSESYMRFIPVVVIKQGDWSVTEHASVTVEIVHDRGMTHEIVRHRPFSPTMESTRFINYNKKMPPSYISPFLGGNKVEIEATPAYKTWLAGVEDSDWRYRRLISDFKVAPQIARSSLPHALAAKISLTGNFRMWRHFLLMRTTKDAHPQMRQIAIPLLKDFQITIPFLYDDIIPLLPQETIMPKVEELWMEKEYSQEDIDEIQGL